MSWSDIEADLQREKASSSRKTPLFIRDRNYRTRSIGSPNRAQENLTSAPAGMTAFASRMRSPILGMSPTPRCVINCRPIII